MVSPHDPLRDPLSDSPSEPHDQPRNEPLDEARNGVPDGPRPCLAEDSLRRADRTARVAAEPPRAALPAPRVGVALGGGSARGFAHIGALEVLERNDLAPHVIAGTSFGALVGALYASGSAPARIVEVAESQGLGDLAFRILDLGLHRGALLSGRRFEAYLDELFEGRDFRDLDVPLAVVATDVDSGERVMLDSGPLARAVRASCAMPGMLAPVEIGGRRLIDGGVGTPVPLDTLDGFELDIAIGIGAGKEHGDSRTLRRVRRFLRSDTGRRLHDYLEEGRTEHPIGQLRRALALTAHAWLAERESGRGLEVHTHPPIDWFHFHRAGDAVVAGRSALEAFLPEIHAALDAAGGTDPRAAEAV